MGSPIEVLHVDDDPELADVTADFLEREDDRFDVETATSVDAGLDRLADGGVDCVVSDYDMPGRDGLEFLTTVREDHPQLPFILYTGKGSEAVASEAISMGVTDYLQKQADTDHYALLANRIVNAVEGYLAEQEADWQRTIIRNMGEGVYVIDDEYTLQYANFRVPDVDGATEEGLTGRSLSYIAERGILPAAEVQQIRDGVDRLLRGATDEVNVELRPEVLEQTPVLALRLTAIGSRAGTDRDLVLGTTRDVTELSETEGRLKRFRAFVEQSPDLMTLLDDHGRIQYNNSAVESMLGYAQGELVGEDPLEYVHPEDRERIATELSALLTDAGRGPTVRFRFRTADGSWAWVESQGTNRLDDPEINGIIVNQRDIGDQREYERELERQNEWLEQFASLISHDLRNPLQVAKTRASLAREHEDTSYLDGAADAFSRMETLLDDLLRLARHGQRVSEMEPVALGEVARGCWQTVATADATLAVEADRTVLADRSRLKELFENLFRNAVEHDAGVGVTVADHPGGFAVADTGPGIPADDRDRVFEAGYTTTEAGTGFGLHIVEEIAEAHGWAVAAAESDAGGARFEVTGVERPE